MVVEYWKEKKGQQAMREVSIKSLDISSIHANVRFQNRSPVVDLISYNAVGGELPLISQDAAAKVHNVQTDAKQFFSHSSLLQLALKNFSFLPLPRRAPVNE